MERLYNRILGIFGRIIIWMRSDDQRRNMENRKTYLIEVMYYDTHNTEVITITTDNAKWSMEQYQRNRKPFDWEILDWKREGDTRLLQDEREIDS